MAGNDTPTSFTGKREETKLFLDSQPTSESGWTTRNSKRQIIYLT